jgi:hypothetical protein
MPAAKDPRARPDIQQLLNTPAVQAHMNCVPTDDEGAWVGEEMRQHMLSTIKVPMGFGYGQVRIGGPGGLCLPAPSFPQARPAADSESSKESAPLPSAPTTADSKENGAGFRPTAAPQAPLAPSAAPGAAAQFKRPLSAAPPQVNNVAPIAGGKPGQLVAGGYKPAPILAPAAQLPGARIAAPISAGIAAANAAKAAPALGYRPTAGGVPSAAPSSALQRPQALAPVARYPAVPAYGGAAAAYVAARPVAAVGSRQPVGGRIW